MVRPMFIREGEFRGPEETNKKVAKCIVKLNAKICLRPGVLHILLW